MPPTPDSFDWTRDESPVSTHQAGSLGYYRQGGGTLVFAVVFVVAAVMCFLFVTQRDVTIGVGGGVLCLLLAFGTKLMVDTEFKRLIKEVVVYPKGITWLKGESWLGARWEDISKAQRTVRYVNNQLMAKFVAITTKGGETAVFERALSNWEGLADTIQIETAKFLVEPSEDNYRAGKTLEFGEISVDQKGVTIKKEFIPWQDVKDVRIGNGHLRFYRPGFWNGGWKSIPLGDVPNAPVLLKVLEECPCPKVRVSKWL
jgi:hypothetical protein